MIGDLNSISNEIIVLPQHQPVIGLKCPISLSKIQHPVYLKGCEHVFEREIIEKFFREALLVEKVIDGKVFGKSEVKCPECRRPYSIVKLQRKFGNRTQAIDAFFKKILIVPIINIAINQRLEKAIDNEKVIKKMVIEIKEQDEKIKGQNEKIREQNLQILSKNRDIIQLQNTLDETISLKDREIDDLKQNIESGRKVKTIALASGVGTFTLGCIMIFIVRNNSIKIPEISIPELPSLPSN